MPSSLSDKRKREPDEDEADVSSRGQVKDRSRSRSNSPNSSVKKARIVGPTLPPSLQAGNASPDNEKEDDSDSSDDDFGPSLPKTNQDSTTSEKHESIPDTLAQKSAPAKVQRDEWMLLPPSSGDWTSRVDPTKLKNRKFNSGKGAKGPSQKSGNAGNPEWTETTEEKLARLQKEMLGIKSDSQPAAPLPGPDAREREQSQRLKDYNVSNSIFHF